MNLALLLATIAALLSGPLLYQLAQRRPQIVSWLDRFVLFSVVSLVLIEVVPETYQQAGLWSFAFLAIGLLGPTALEQLLTRARREAHIAALVLAIIGLMLHSFGDGAALSPANGQGHFALALAVAIHSVPVGLLVWWLMFPVFGATLPALTLAAMCGCTLGGYVFGMQAAEAVDARYWALFQALVAGSILHVVFGRRHSHAH
jgi:zinc transporter ZupT